MYFIRISRTFGWLLLLLIAFMTVANACGESPSSDSKAVLKVATTTSIAGDWVKNVGGDRVEVFSLEPPDADPHTFQPGAKDVAAVADADLVFSSGLGLGQTWLSKLVKNAAKDPSKVTALGDSLDVQSVLMADPDGDEAEGPYDPHFWFDLTLVKQAVAVIAEKLSQADPNGADFYKANAESYASELDQLDSWIMGHVSGLPQERRVMVTSHDTFKYFAKRYGFKIVGTIVPGSTTDIDPSAADMARLLDNIKAQHVPAIFTENTVNDLLARRISEEAGVKVVRKLYTDSLGSPGSEGDTYLNMMRWDVRTMVEALAGEAQ